jgi:hypothetical protein
VSTGGWIAVAVLGLAVGGLTGVWRHTASRLDQVERRLRLLRAEVHEARAIATRATDCADRAARAAGLPEEPPPLAFEAVTGPVVRTLAWVSGARRFVRRLSSTRVVSDRAIR